MLGESYYQLTRQREADNFLLAAEYLLVRWVDSTLSERRYCMHMKRSLS